MKNILSKSEKHTFSIAYKFGKCLKKGDIVGLIGELGSGKTVFTKGIAKRLGINSDIVTSPTFTIINEYESNKGTLFHFDLYRIDSVTELKSLGYEEYFYSDGIVVIEWAEKCENLLPPKSYLIYFEYLNETQRNIKFSRKK